MTLLAAKHGRVGGHPASLVRSLPIVVAVLLVFAGGSAAIAAPVDPTATCAPGSGPHLPERHLTASRVPAQTDFSCADLQGADLSGLSLIQVDFRSANLAGAKLSKTDLGQANLAGADLSDADLSGAGLIQATLTGAQFVGAALTDARMGQVEAQSTNFSGADLSAANLVGKSLPLFCPRATGRNGARGLGALARRPRTSPPRE